MNARGWFFLNKTGGQFPIDGAACQIDVSLIPGGGARVRVQIRDAPQGEGGRGAIIQDVELREPGDSAKVVVEEL